MIRSMTGFARRERQHPWGLLAWELKTVNHRFAEVSCRLPEEFRVAEADFRQAIATAVRRGKADCTLHFKPSGVDAALQLDAALLGALTAKAQALAAQVGSSARTDVLDLLRWPGVIRDGTRDPAPLLAAAHALLGEALAELIRSRDAEGQRLVEALEARCAALTEFAGNVAARLPEVHARIRARLTDRIAQLTQDADPARLEQELAILAQRLDVDEELHRLEGHVIEVRNTFAAADAAGRRLDFLMQELNREANTLASKSQDIETTKSAVDMKVLIEQMREQVQNIE